MRRASSTPQSSSGVRWPAKSPNREASTAPICSTSTLVLCPSRSISGRNEAARADFDVGATTTTDRGSNSSAWSTTPKRSPCCSCPVPFGSLNRKTSPRSTHRLHQLRYRKHLGSIKLVGFEPRRFSGQSSATQSPPRRLDQRTTDRLRAVQTGRLQDAQSLRGIIIKPDRDSICHSSNVSHIAIRLLLASSFALESGSLGWRPANRRDNTVATERGRGPSDPVSAANKSGKRSAANKSGRHNVAPRGPAPICACSMAIERVMVK